MSIGIRGKLTYGFGLLLFVACFSLLRPAPTNAAINSQINFQGKLTNPDGTNVADGTYSLRFRIYNDPSADAANACAANSCQWEETQGSVSVSAGIFQVNLGSVTSLPGSVDFNTSGLYLGIKVDSDAEMTPRILFTATPYSFNSSMLGGLSATNYVQLAQGIQTDASTTNASIGVNKTVGTAKLLDLQRGGTSVATINNDGTVLFKNQANSATALQVQTTGSVAILTVDTTNNEVMIGSGTTDNTTVLLQIDSYDTFADASTCTTTNNQGGLYYNTKSNAIRACINGTWEDLISTAALGMQLFGVVPDSGSSPGDLSSVTGAQNGPCKVSVGTNTTTVSWTACTAYSGGRKVIVAAGTATTTNTVAARFQHLCLTGTDSQPALSTSGTETANLATVSFPSVTAPILCLADIRYAAANNTITTIYDTRVFTTTEKVPVSLNSAIGLGTIVVNSATKGVVASTTTANTTNIAGVIVATTGAASTTTINAFMATSGPVPVKATAGTVNRYIFTTATAGYAATSATKPAEGTGTIYNVLGNARNSWSGGSACTANNDTCAGSIITYIDKR